MTTMLERAARAAMTVCVGVNEEGDDVYVGLNTAEELASAVLMAVREPDAETQVEAWLWSPDGEYSDFQRASDFTAMIDAILEDK